MTRDEVIKGLESVKETLQDMRDTLGVMWIDDALALLKAEPKRGRWTTHRTMLHNGEWYCDQCDYEPTIFEATKFCPKCGAIMEVDA